MGKKPFLALFSLLTLACLFSNFSSVKFEEGTLRERYSRSPNLWPAASIDSGVVFRELAPLPKSPVNIMADSVKDLAFLGKVLFFDRRLSGSNQISCSSCHAPDMHWTDGRQVSIGNDHSANKRNAPTLENVWAAESLFWDGRSFSLEDQANSPISSEVEMHQDIDKLPAKLKKIAGYRSLFNAAYGDKKISIERITHALATYQRGIASRPTDFDAFMEGRYSRLTDEQIEGLHLFRTKARCINCHNGPFLTDGLFHNVGLTYYGRKYEDLGRYEITKYPEDVGKFKTPGLRNVMKTAPYFHNGLFPEMQGVLNMYNAGMPRPKRKEGQENDPLFPKTDPLLKKLDLSKTEMNAIIAFLESLSSATWRDRAPEEMPE